MLADLDRIVTEAQHRWLRPNEICEILRNHQRFQLRSDPPVRPPGCNQHASLFLISIVCWTFGCNKQMNLHFLV